MDGVVVEEPRRRPSRTVVIVPPAHAGGGMPTDLAEPAGLRKDLDVRVCPLFVAGSLARDWI